MCGRFTLSTSPAVIAEIFELRGTPRRAPRYNIARPSRTVGLKADG
jgi:putative SOS response-associated peptidase YedK